MADNEEIVVTSAAITAIVAGCSKKTAAKKTAISCWVGCDLGCYVDRSFERTDHFQGFAVERRDGI